MIRPEFVRYELSKVTAVKESGGGLWIPCPFHHETKPSLQISLGKKVAAGVFKCFGCNESGNWNKLAEKLGLTTITSDGKKEGDATFYVNPQEVSLYQPVDEESLTLEPLREGWKKYSIDFLEKFDAKLLWHDEYIDYFIYLPVTYINDYCGYIRVRLNSKLGPKYFFVLQKKIFYPFDYLLQYKTDTLVLVEGVADVFRLLKYRVPTLSILGTSFDMKLGLEMLNTLSVKTIILCMDGDLPGKQANIKLYKELTSHKFDVRVLQLPFKYKLGKKNPTTGKREVIYTEKCDPDDMDLKYIKVLRKMVVDTGPTLLPKGK